MNDYDRLYLGAAIVYGLSKGVLSYKDSVDAAMELDKVLWEATSPKEAK